MPARCIGVATAAISLVGLGFTALNAAWPGGAELAVPFGLPGQSMLLGMDRLSGPFLFVIFLLGTAAGLTEADHRPTAAARALPLFVGAMALVVLAADGFGLLLGVSLMSVASFVLIASRPEVLRAAELHLGIGMFAAVCLAAAMALLSWGPAGLDLRYAAVRAHPPEGARAVAILGLVLLGAGARAGLAPLHAWLPPVHVAAHGHVGALLSGAVAKVALYAMLRLLLDLCGPAQPFWWGVPLLMLGTVSAALGNFRACLAPDMKATLAEATIAQVGFAAIGLGLALCARAADQPGLAELALGATLLQAVAHGCFMGLLFLVAGAAHYAAGTGQLAGLGGLIHRMPVTAGCALIGAASLAAIPLSAGFAGGWMLLQAALAAPRIGGLGFQMVMCVVVVGVAGAVGLGAVAAVRLVGVAFLGRPRTPRAAAAQEAAFGPRVAMILLAGATLVTGVVPGALALGSPGGSAYLPLALLLVLAAAGALPLLPGSRLGARRTRSAPAWDGGFGPAPAWQPHGDPLTQVGAVGFAQPIRRMLATRRAVEMPSIPAGIGHALSAATDRMLRPGRHGTLIAMAATLALFLAAIAVAGL